MPCFQAHLTRYTTKLGTCSSSRRTCSAFCPKDTPKDTPLVNRFRSTKRDKNLLRARTDRKNPFHKSIFRGSPLCFKGSNPTRAGRAREDLLCRGSKFVRNLFHGILAYAFCASFRASFRGKTQFSTCLVHCATRWSLKSRERRAANSRKTIHFSKIESRTRLQIFVSRRSAVQNKAFSARFCPRTRTRFFPENPRDFPEVPSGSCSGPPRRTSDPLSLSRPSRGSATYRKHTCPDEFRATARNLA